MNSAKNGWLVSAIVATLASACGDSGGSNDGDGTNGNGNGATNNGAVDAAVDSATPPSGLGPDDVTAKQCGAQADGTPLDTSKKDGCYYFYCYQTKESLLAQSNAKGACANAADVAVQCLGQSVRTVSDCAREKAGVLAVDGEAKFAEAVTTCARNDTKLAAFSNACLACNVDSSVCAARKCLIECVTGDSQRCDQCREENKCTPDFYTCAGLPNPLD